MFSKKIFITLVVIFVAVGVYSFIAYIIYDENSIYLVSGGLSSLVISSAAFIKSKTD